MNLTHILVLNSNDSLVWIAAGESFKTKNTDMPFSLASRGLLIEDKAGDSSKKIQIEFSDATNVLLTFILTKVSASSWTYQFQVNNMLLISTKLIFPLYLQWIMPNFPFFALQGKDSKCMTSAAAVPVSATPSVSQDWVVYKTPISLVLQGYGSMAAVYPFEAGSDCAKIFASPVTKVKFTAADELTVSITPVGK